MAINEQDRTLPVTIEDNAIHTNERISAVRVGLTFAAMVAFVAVFLYGVNSQRPHVAQSDQPAAQANAQAERDAQPPPAQNEPAAQQTQQPADRQQGPAAGTTGQGGNQAGAQGGREPRPAQQPLAAPQKNPPKDQQPSTPNRNEPSPPQGDTRQ